MTTYLPAGDPTAVGGRRIVGYLIDWVLFFSIIPGILFFATADFTTYTDGPTCTNLKRSGEIDDSYFCTRAESTDADGQVSYDTFVMKKNAFVIANAAAGGYLIVVMWLLQGLTGATIGKLVVGIRTVNEQGRSPGLGKQLLRGIAGIVDAVPFCLMPLVPVVGLITIFVTKGHRRVGDMAAKTYVVKASAKGAPIVIPGAGGAAPGYVPPAPGSVPPAPGSVPPAPGYAPPAPAGAPTPPPPSGFAVPPPPGAASTPPPPAGWAPPAAPPSEPAGPTPPATPPPAEPSGWAAPGGPAPEASETPAAPTSPGEGPQPGVSGPQWDAQRNAYVQWDPDAQRWLTYDDAAGEWKPLS